MIQVVFVVAYQSSSGVNEAQLFATREDAEDFRMTLSRKSGVRARSRVFPRPIVEGR